jgi:DNA-binding NtrC family response regulator
MLNVLVVDDSVLMRERLVELVTEACAGVNVTQAGSVMEALSELDGDPFDLVLLDMLLPDGDGTMVLEVVKQRTPATRVAVMTRFPAYRKRCRILKADYFFCKYEEMEAAMATIRRLAEGKEGRAL